MTCGTSAPGSFAGRVGGPMSPIEPGTCPYRQANTPTYASLRSTISSTFVSGGDEPATMSSMAITS